MKHFDFTYPEEDDEIMAAASEGEEEEGNSLPTALPVALPAGPNPLPPTREEPTPPAIPTLIANVRSASTEQEREDAQDRILLRLDDDVRTKQEMLDLYEGYGFDSGRFYIDDEGILFYVRQRYSKGGEECFNDETYLCSGNLRVIGEIKRTDGPGHHFSREVQFKNRWKETAKIKIADNLTPSAVLRILAANGLEMTTIAKDRPRIVEFLNGWKVRRHVIAVHQRWYAGAYITSRGAIGPTPAGQEIVLADTFHDDQTYCGTLEGWQKTIGEASIGNRILIDCLSVAFSAFVLEPLNAECMGFMLFCDSSMGKGSTVSAACSVAGTKLSDCIDTPYNIETHATRNSDTLIVFDELTEAKNPAEFSRNIYLLGNGRGKGRSTKEKSTWRVPWIVTGETSMSEVRADAKMKPLTRGETVRLIEIFADAGKGLGTFDTVHEAKDAQHFADALQIWSKQNQGVAAEAFLSRLTADLPYAIKKLNETREAFMAAEKARLSLTNAPPDLIRALDHFAVAAASGELATEFSTVPWQAGDAIRAVSATFESWYRTQYKVIEDPQIGVRQAIKWITANMKRFEQSPIRNGYRDYDIPVEAFRNGACAGLRYKDVANQLKAEGKLIHDRGGFTLKRNRAGNVKYDVYCVRLPVGDIGDIGDIPEPSRASKAVN